MRRIPVKTDKAPAAIGPYSQAIVTDSLLFTSGSIPIDPQTGALPEGSIEDHAHLVFRNLAAIAEAAGTRLDKAVRCRAFLAEIAHFQRETEG